MALDITGKVGWWSGSVNVAPSQDADALAFITAANITDTTQKSAINTLVTQLKTYGIWTKLKAVYPFVGGTASSHKFNLKDPRDLDAAFRLVFAGGWTHSSTGALPNGTTAYADTKLNTNVLSITNTSFSLYLRSTTRPGGSLYPVDLGAFTSDYSGRYGLSYISSDGNSYFDVYNRNTINNSNFNTGLVQYSRTSSTLGKVFYQNTLVDTNTSGTNTYANPNITIYLGALHLGTGIDSYSNREQAFASIGDGLTDTEAANFYTAVQTFQTTLGRQVGVPIVADSDAQAFLNAAVITNQTQANAINTLVTDLKSANIWTKMKAIYPFVGGTATTHKFNLKDPRDLDAAFRLVFNGGWTHSSTGALPNGTNGYADTFFRPFTHLTNVNSAHFSKYNRTNDLVGNKLDGIYEGSSNTAFQFAYSIGYTNLGNFSSGISYTPTDTRGFFTTSRTSSTSIKAYRNAIQQGSTNTATNTTMPNKHVVLGARSDDNAAQFFYNTYEAAFASIGDGLTDAEATAFYNAVQAYQTTLSRNV